MMREESAFEVDIIHGASASNLLLDPETSEAQITDKSNHLEYDDQYKDDFGEIPMADSEGGMLGKKKGRITWVGDMTKLFLSLSPWVRFNNIPFLLKCAQVWEEGEVNGT